MRNLRCWLLIFCISATSSGVLCQFTGPSDGGTCAGERISFTCVVASGATLWRVNGGEGGVCLYSSNAPDIEVTCGPGGRFTSSQTEGSSDVLNSSLSAFLTDDLNGTTVECIDGTVGGDFIGSYNICVVGNASAPLIISADFNERGETGCTLRVEWSEAFISCAGSVSQYVLSVTPPTSDCQSGSGDCQLVTDGTQYNLTLTVDQTYSLSLRADACSNTLLGPTTDPVSITTLSATVESCDVLYKCSPRSGSLTAVDIVWTPSRSGVQPAVEYTVVIDDGVGSPVRQRVAALNCSSTQCSHTYYPAVGSRAEFGVSVETAGCVTRQTVCRERPVYCSVRDLSPSLVEVNRVCGSVSGGEVCYSGDSVGSVAVYFCDDGYTLEGDSTREYLSSGLWNGTTPQCVETNRQGCRAEDCVPSPAKDTSGTTTVVVASVVCSLVFLSVGVLLGGVGLYLILRVRGRLSGQASSNSQACAYEDVSVARKVKSSNDIQLTSNEAYGPIPKDNIRISQNAAYGQVHL